MNKKWRCSHCAIFDWLEMDSYPNRDAGLTAIRKSHRSKSPHCPQENPDIFGEVEGPFSAEMMPFLDWLESEVRTLELRAASSIVTTPDRHAQAAIVAWKNSLLIADHTLGFGGLAVEAGKRIANQWRRLNTVESKLCLPLQA